jgi:hypothetical protein
LFNKLIGWIDTFFCIKQGTPPKIAQIAENCEPQSPRHTNGAYHFPAPAHGKLLMVGQDEGHPELLGMALKLPRRATTKGKSTTGHHHFIPSKMKECNTNQWDD